MPDEETRKADPRLIWAQVGLATFIGMIPVSAALVALNVLPPWGDGIASGYLWVLGVPLVLLTSLASWSELGRSKLERRQRIDPRMRKYFQYEKQRAQETPENGEEQDLRWHPLAQWIFRLSLLTTPILLVLVDRTVLAGLYGLLILTGMGALEALNAVPSKQEAQRRSLVGRIIRTMRRSIGVAFVYLGYLVAVPLGLITLTLIIFFAWPFSWASGRDLGRSLCDTSKKPEGLIYFVYAESHQRDHFLGDGGALQPFSDQVVARDWREDLKPEWERLDWEAYRASPEFRLLEVFSITRIRDHLPFVAVISPHSRPRAFKPSKAYRARRRDKGAALRSLEDKIRKAADEALGSAPA